MKLSICAAAALGLAVLPLVAAAQASNPVSTAFKASLKSASGKMVAAAAEMPADKFSFKPTPESMSFGQLTLHIATSNTSSCHAISGAPAAPKTTLTAASPKQDLVDLLKSSYDYCSRVVANVDDSKLGSMVPSYGGRQVSQAQAMFILSDDWADHYSQQAAYLRLNGMLPPTAQHRGRGR